MLLLVLVRLLLLGTLLLLLVLVGLLLLLFGVGLWLLALLLFRSCLRFSFVLLVLLGALRLLRGVRRSSNSENAEQNCCDDASNVFHMYVASFKA